MEKLINKTNKLISYLYMGYIVALMTSFLLMQVIEYLIIVLVFFVFIYELVKNKKSIFESNKLNLLSLVVIITFIFATVTSPFLLDDDVIISKIFLKFTVFIMIPFNYLMLKRYLDFNKAIKICFYVLLPMALYVLFQFLTGFNPRHSTYSLNFGISNFVTGFYSNYLIYSYIYQLYMFAIIGLLIKKVYKGKIKAVLSCLAVILFVTIIFSGSRMSYLSIITGIFTLFMFTRNKKILLVFLSSILIFGLSYKYNRFLKMKLDRTVENISRGGDDIRFENWKYNIDVFKKYPIKGIGHWINVMKSKDYFEAKEMNVKKYVITHAHNNYLQVLSSGGILGFLAFFSLWFYIYYFLIKTYRFYNRRSMLYETGLSLGILAGLSTLIISGMTECTFFAYAINNNISFFVAIAYILYEKTKKNEEILKI